MDNENKISIETFFKNSFVISINKQRYSTFIQVFNKIFKHLPFPKLIIGNTNKLKSNIQNCKDSHIKVIENAKKLNLPYVLVFEDDAYPCKDCLTKLNTILKNIPNDINFLLLGWSSYTNKKQCFNNIINKISSIFAGAHSYILFEDAYDQYLNYFKKHINDTADGYVYNNITNAYVVNEPLFIQYCKNISMNNHYGYIFNDKNICTKCINSNMPPDNFYNINEILQPIHNINIKRQAIIVSMTSWVKRISNCAIIIKNILNNTIIPDKIYLNLSTEEFIDRDKNLPYELLDLCNKNSRVVINWVTGPNTKTMKKIFPILQYLDDNDVIIDTDDDLLLPNTFIEQRLAEFNKFKQKYPISGSNNPKWHTNKIISGILYNCCGATSIFLKKMLKNYNLFLTPEIIKTYNDDTLYTLLCLHNGYIVKPTQLISTPTGISNEKIKIYNDNNKLTSGSGRGYSSDEEIVLLFNERHKKIFGKTLTDKLRKKTLVLTDSMYECEDNAQVLYRYLNIMHEHEFNLIFLISNKSDKYQQLIDNDYNVIAYEDPQLLDILEFSNYIMFSKLNNQVLKKYLLTNKEKGIFLDHGWLNKIYSCDKFYLDTTIAKTAKYYCVETEDEKQLISDRFTVITNAKPRLDILLNKNKEYQQIKNKNKKQILFQFHWRSNLTTNELFEKSMFLNSINDLINNYKLLELKEIYNCEYVFLLHPMNKKYETYFKIPEYFKKANVNFQDNLIHADCLITDFSSNAFQMAYIKKPTLYFIPDYDNVISAMPQYNIKAFNLYKHGILSKTTDSLFARLILFLNNQLTLSYEQIPEKNDSNCENIYKALLKL